MPSSQDQGFFAEHTDFSLILARTNGKGRSVIIEELLEAPVTEKSAIGDAIRTVFPAGIGPLSAAAIRPATELHLATPDEAKRYATPSAVQKFGRERPELAASVPGFFATIAGREGAGAPWLLAATAAAAHAKSLGALEEFQLKPVSTVSASLHGAGALVAALKARGSDAAVLCLDFGAMSGHALVVSRRGIESVGAVPASLDSIAEAAQIELGLKFKGSAAKLFLNELYDFSEAGANIAGRLAPVLKPAIAALGGTAPTELYCAGIPAKQQWLAVHLAPALGLTLHLPDIKSWCAGAGISFANPALEISPTWLRFLHFIHTETAAAPVGVWSTGWTAFDAVIASPAASALPPPPVITPPPAPAPRATPVAPPLPAPKSAPVAVPAAKPTPAPFPVARPAPSLTPGALKPAPVLSRSTPSQAPLPPRPPSAPAPAKPVASPNKPAAPQGKPASASGKPSAPPAKPAVPPVKAYPVPVNKPTAPAKPLAPVGTLTKPAKKGGAGMLVGIGLAALALIVGGYFFMQWKNEQAEQARLKAEEIQRTEKAIRDEAEKIRLAAEQKARVDAEIVRRKLEAEMNQKLAEAETARQAAEVEARAQAAARLANARGTVVIATEPAGANVTIGGLPPRISPATFSDVKIGKHTVNIALAQHDEVNFEIEVTENNTTQPEAVKLARLSGDVEVSSEPAGVKYELRPANVMVVAPDAIRTGTTPATIANLNPGDYTVTFTQEGWAPHSETVSVSRNALARVAWTFRNGVVKISSTPEGATVTREGTSLGVTPLTLSDIAPGDARYELNLANHEPATLTGRVEDGKIVTLNASLLSFDRLASTTELTEQPRALNPVQPVIPAALRAQAGRVEIELVVSRTGTVSDLRVVSAPSPELGQVCLAAVARWRFAPGSINGRPMNVRVVVPLVVGTR